MRMETSEERKIASEQGDPKQPGCGLREWEGSWLATGPVPLLPCLPPAKNRWNPAVAFSPVAPFASFPAEHPPDFIDDNYNIIGKWKHSQIPSRPNVVRLLTKLCPVRRRRAY